MFRLAACSLAACVLVLSGCATADAARLRAMSAGELANAFRPCAGALGVHADAAKLLLQDPPTGEGLELIALSTSGIVSDGFNHMLAVDRSRSVAYIPETGGFAGVFRWYGPLTLKAKCA